MQTSSHYVVFQPTLLDNPRLTIPRFGIHEHMPAQIVNRVSGNDAYLLMLFHTPVSIRIGPTVHECGSGTFILWEPGQPHWYGNAHRQWVHSWIHFDGSLARESIGRSALPRNRPFVLPDTHIVARYLQAIHTEIESHHRPDQRIIGNFLANWLLEMERALSGPQAPTVPPEILLVKQYLEANYQKPVRLSQLAAMAFLSVPRFCALFKQHVGYSAIDFAIRLRMRHAAFLLRDVNMRVKAVAESVGYADLYYFSKMFRRHHGVSPRMYRRGARGEP